MNGRFRKALALFVCCLLALSLSACGTKKDETTSQTVVPESATTGTVSPSSDKPIEVVFWHSTSGATGEALESIIKNYNEGPGKEKNIFVNLVYQGYAGTDKVILAYQTKDYVNAPDINQGLTSTLPSMMDMDWSVSVARFLDDSNYKVGSDTFYEAMQRAVTYQGEMVAVPFAMSIPVLYYNEDMLKEAGYEQPPQTMDELTEYVRNLTVMEDGKVTRHGLNMQVKRYQLVQFVNSQGEVSYFGDNEGGRLAPMTKIVAGEDGTLKNFLEKLQDLLNTGGYKYIENNINEEFAQGLSAMVIMSSSRMGTLDSLMPGKYKAAVLPKVNSTDQGGAGIGGSCLSLIDRGDEARLKAAWDVMEYVVSPENQYILATASGYIPVNVATEDMPEMQAYYRAQPQYKVTLDQMKASNPHAQEPLDLTYNEINGIITEVMLEFCQGNLTVDEAVEKVVSKCNQSLDEYHRAND